MAEENDQDKTEAATPQKLQKARDDGDIPRSKELTTLIMLIGGVGVLYTCGSLLRIRATSVMEESMRFDRARAFDSNLVLAHLWAQAEHMLLGLAPVFIALLVLALVAPALLGGWVFSAKAFAPKLSNLNPIKGVQKMFSLQALNELGKGIAKSALVGSVAVWYLHGQLPELMSMSSLTLEQGLGEMMYLITLGCALMVSSLLVVVMMDVPYQLYSFAKKMRMSKEEIKREFKENEGDPHVKGKIRAQQQAMARSRMMTEVPKADVIVTNPTHFAVALAYRDGEMSAPRVVAKGADEVAARIRELGAEHEIPLLSAPPLARALYWHVDLNQEVPAALYTAVAEVLAWVYRLKRVSDEPGLDLDAPKDLPVPDGMDEAPQDKTRKSRNR